MTTLYFIRHAPSDFTLEGFHDRPLSQAGTEGAQAVLQTLKDIPFDTFISSSSPRAIDTIRPLADAQGKSIETHDELRELLLRGPEVELSEEEVLVHIQRVFEEPSYKLSGGESREEVERRGISSFELLLKKCDGQTIAFGTHGIIMTLILDALSPHDGARYGYEYWSSLSKPDIYKATITDNTLTSLERVPLLSLV